MERRPSTEHGPNGVEVTDRRSDTENRTTGTEPRPGSAPPGRASTLAAVLVASVLLAGCGGTGEDDAPPADLAIENVAVVDVSSGTVEEARTVLVRDDRIVAVGPAGEVEAGAAARVVDGSGRYLMPGLWDMHVHLTYVESTLPLYLAHGVTGVRDMGGAADSVMNVRERVRDGSVDGPWIVAAGPLVDGPKPDIPWRLTVETAEEGVEAVDSVASLGADFVKVHNGIAPEPFRAVVGRAEELGLRTAGHAPPSVGLAEAVEVGQNSIEHTTAILEAVLEPPQLASLDTLRSSARAFLAGAGEGVFGEMATGNVYATPTVVAGFAAARRMDPDRDPAPEEGWVTEGVRNFWALMPAPDDPPPALIEARMAVADLGLEMVAALSAAGVPLMAGTDVGLPTVVPGSSLHEELELLVRSGLTPAEALRSATLVPARYLDAADTLGSVASGKRADLVLLEGDPLEDITNTRRIEAVVVRGELLDRETLDRMLPPVR